MDGVLRLASLVFLPVALSLSALVGASTLLQGVTEYLVVGLYVGLEIE
jgi:hypothetical protein